MCVATAHTETRSGWTALTGQHGGWAARAARAGDVTGLQRDVPCARSRRGSRLRPDKEAEGVSLTVSQRPVIKAPAVSGEGRAVSRPGHPVHRRLASPRIPAQ